MHILEKFSLNCGINPLKLEKAEIFSSYYPLPFEKYIVFHACKEIPSKSYSYYQDVIDFVHESATKNGYGFLQIGEAEDKNLDGCLNLNGKINIFQTSFILKNASLLIGNDSFSTHICSSYGVPSISLYSVIQPEVAGPYWKNGKQITLMSPLNGNKPSYSKEDPQRIIDNIKPEDIINYIQKLLPDLVFNKPETLFIGKNYGSQAVDIIPDSNLKPNIPDNIPINLRFDLLKTQIKEENFLSASICSEGKKFFVTLSSNVDIFKIFKKENQQNLLSIILIINDKNYSNKKDLKKLCEEIKKNGAPFRVIYESRSLSEKQINDLKFDFLDVAPLFEKKIDKNQEEKFLNTLNNTSHLTLIKSSHILFSSGKIFNSEESYRQEKPSTSLLLKLKDLENPELLAKECDNFYLYNI